MPRREALQALKEIEIHGRLTNCPFTVKYHDSFISGTKVNIIMDYCNNGDLQGLLNTKRCANRTLLESQILHLFIPLCLGLLSMHDMKILHRDLKTQNIFISKSGEVRIGDFGLAVEGQVKDQSQLKTEKPYNFEVENTTKVGTPFYLAPELCYEETRLPYSVKSDVWALGVILYELYTLRKPFLAKNQDELYKLIKNEKPAPIPKISHEM